MSRNPNSVGHWCHYKMYPQKCRVLWEFLSWTYPTTGRNEPGLKECLTSCWILTTDPEWAVTQESAYPDMSFLIKEWSPVWRLDESSWVKWTHVVGEFTHLHAYLLTVLQKRNKNVWTSHRFFSFTKWESRNQPDKHVHKFWFNYRSFTWPKPDICGDKKTKTRENKQPKKPPAWFTNVAPLSRIESCVTVVDTI